MTFAFIYEDVTKKPNPMVKINPLARGTGKMVSLQDRVDSLNKSAAWKKTIKAWSRCSQKQPKLTLLIWMRSFFG